MVWSAHLQAAIAARDAAYYEERARERAHNIFRIETVLRKAEDKTDALRKKRRHALQAAQDCFVEVCGYDRLRMYYAAGRFQGSLRAHRNMLQHSKQTKTRFKHLVRAWEAVQHETDVAYARLEGAKRAADIVRAFNE